MIKKELSFLLVALFIGCGDAGPPLAEVSGIVTFDGEPLPTGTITFVPQGEDIPYAYATIQGDGTYYAKTPEYGNGVPIGNHKIMISAMKDMGPEAPVELLIPSKYSSDQNSGLTANVVAGENTINFPLEVEKTKRKKL
ncbi:hypothetical protein [Rubinisphaera italica]|uniref:Carboxypeptidase regulatory-like domain-containing protein n=1 Tax=Rubinisphaera italica TaxID=2527969 RepID=A0A5C5XKG2_9PLAN|nr:hypothetical protein [Rubinisphaera italica]TWT63029.1 hypothetical protein Pan54_37800 [Rubinisphaera italica]